jgi:hypothetical protein
MLDTPFVMPSEAKHLVPWAKEILRFAQNDTETYVRPFLLGVITHEAHHQASSDVG